MSATRVGVASIGPGDGEGGAECGAETGEGGDRFPAQESNILLPEASNDNLSNRFLTAADPSLATVRRGLRSSGLLVG